MTGLTRADKRLVAGSLLAGIVLVCSSYYLVSDATAHGRHKGTHSWLEEIAAADGKNLYPGAWAGTRARSVGRGCGTFEISIKVF